MAAPTIWNTMNSGTDSQAMPEGVGQRAPDSHRWVGE